jgi:hypothetical protein
MAQNLVIPNKDNKVVLLFNGIVLIDATNIVVQFGNEIYSTLTTPDKVVVTPATAEDPECLTLDLSETLEVGKIFATVTYFDSASVNGTDITSRELNNLDKIVVAVGSQLIIEDGSIVDLANSYASDEEFKVYANLRNFDIPATQPDREALLLLAMDYLGGKESSLKGCRVSIDQELSWPRKGVCAKNFNVASDSIPKDIKKAQMELAIQASTSELLVNASVQNIQREKLGDLEVEYFSGGSWTTVDTARANTYLNYYNSLSASSNLTLRV